ncbi:His Kinase A domain containing protein [Mortierella sp. GBA43]|nr:His Kinase A domain containing protein [Mortierella sp. GBA43]
MATPALPDPAVPCQPPDTWDAFLSDYSKGRLPNSPSHPPPRPKLESATPYPPLPTYVEATTAADNASPPSYLAPPMPPNEDGRLKALYSFQILETGSDANFQRIANLATVLGVHSCMICLVDYDYVCVKANCRADNMDCRRDLAFSSHAILRPPGDPLVVLDTSCDWRFKDLPIVTDGPKVRFYAGAALATADGFNIGTLCVMDPNPRTEFTTKERDLIVDFAAIVMREMELWNDQVQLCTRSRMMRDIARWVRERLDRSGNEPTPEPTNNLCTLPNSDVPTSTHSPAHSIISGDDRPPRPPPPPISGSLAGAPYQQPLYHATTTPFDPALPTPTSSPTLLSTGLDSTLTAQDTTTTTTGLLPPDAVDRLEDVAFPSACGMIQASMNVDVVYLVQASTSKTSIPLSRSTNSWGKLGTSERSKGSVGTLGGGELLTPPKLTLKCLATSQRPANANSDPTLHEQNQARRQGNSWICTDQECRPHRLGDELLGAIEPDWERDHAMVMEMLGYVRQETRVPSRAPGQSPLFTYSKASEEEDMDEPSSTSSSSHPAGIRSKRLLCHTFQGTISDLTTGANSPFRSSVVMPIRGASPASRTPAQDEEPWAYFVVLSSSRTKQFSIQERIYLKNFGSCLVTEVLKRRVEAADKAKGTFIQRTPLHIILGTLELLYANADDTLNDHQLSMIASAEVSGKGLIDIINNIIDLADLDTDHGDNNNNNAPRSLPELYTQVAEVDIRDLCEQVAGSMAKVCSDKNMVLVPTWNSKPSLVSLSSVPMSTSVPSPISGVVAGSIPIPVMSRLDDSTTNGNVVSSADSQHAYSSCAKHASEAQKPAVELLVAMDEPDKGPGGEESYWNFMLNLTVVKRILTQLLENALKFTTTGFVEISAVSPSLANFPLKPPQAGARPILFTVRDTGKGISPDFIEGDLFERFTQEDPMQAGTGLGLALVKLLVESIGGWLEIWSEGIEGKGCVVRVLIWGTPTARKTKSLKHEEGVWQEKSCRFYTGESSPSTDRLWKVIGERMMGQELDMNVKRGDEQDVSPEDMMKDLSDQSPCDLILLNDDLSRLKAYLAYWKEQHTLMAQQGAVMKEPVPLLMLTSTWKDKKARALVEKYRNMWMENGQHGNAATVILMPKPVGPLKLLRCLRACLAGTDDGGLVAQGLLDPVEDLNFTPFPLLRSNSISHISTMALGFHGSSRLASAGATTMVKSSFKFPATLRTTVNGTHGNGIGSIGSSSNSSYAVPYSPRGPIPRPDGPRLRADSLSQQQSEDENIDAIDKGGASDRLGVAGSKSKRQRSIRNFISQRRSSFRGGSGSGASSNSSSRKTSTSNGSGPMPMMTAMSTTTTTTTNGSEEATATGTTMDAQGQPLPVEGEDQLGILQPIPQVLIVEDNGTNRMILKTFLKKRGVVVVEAENGKLGVEKFQEEVGRRQGRSGFEFVLMDLQMPVMDGNMATKRIREFERGMVKQHGLYTPPEEEEEEEEEEEDEDDDDADADDETESGSQKQGQCGYRPTTIFALTGLAGDEDKRLAFECGVDGYLTKPVSLTALGALLSSCHPSHRSSSSSSSESA